MSTAPKTNFLGQTVTVRPKAPKLMVGDMTRAEFTRAEYRIIVNDVGLSVEDVMEPSYWANVAEIFAKANSPFAHIEMIWADCSKRIELLVVAPARLAARVVLLQMNDLTATGASIYPQEVDAINATLPTMDEIRAGEDARKEDHTGYKVAYKGPIRRFAVVRVADGEVISDGHATKDIADKALDDYAKALKN